MNTPILYSETSLGMVNKIMNYLFDEYMPMSCIASEICNNLLGIEGTMGGKLF